MIADAPPAQPINRWTKFRESFASGLRENWLTYLTFIVMVMALAGIMVAITSISQSSEQAKQLQRLVECQNSYNEINNERTRQISESTARENVAEAKADEALLRLTTVIVDPNRSPDAMGKALKNLEQRLSEQNEARRMTEQDRREHPVPPPPRALCGAVPENP